MKYLLALLLILPFATNSQVPPPPSEGFPYNDLKIADPDTPNDNNDRANYYSEKGKYGFVYPKNTRQKAVYDKIIYSSDGFIVIKDGSFGIADKKGNQLSEILYDSIRSLGKIYILKSKRKYGTMNSAGKIILPIKYDKILFSDENNQLSVVQIKNEIVLLHNENLKVLRQKIEAIKLYNNIVVIKEKGMYGVMMKDKVVVPFEYDSIFVSDPAERNTYGKNNVIQSAYDFSHANRALRFLTTKKNGMYGMVSIDGSVLYPSDNDAVHNNSLLGYYSIQKEKLYGIYFTGSGAKTEIVFDKVYADGYGFVMAVKNGKAGVFNLNGKQLTDFEYDNDFVAQYLGLGLRVSKNKKRGIITKEGEVLIPTIYDDLSPFSEKGLRDFIKVKNGEKFGIINHKGETIIPIEYSWIGDENQLFKVATPEPDQKLGLINSSGKIVIPAEYRWITKTATENSKLTLLEKDEHMFNFLNTNYQKIFQDDVSAWGYLHNEDNLLNPFGNAGLYVKDKNGKFGILNEFTCNVDVPFDYDSISQFYAGKEVLYKVRKGKKYGIVNNKNAIIIPLTYEAIDIDLLNEVDGALHFVVAKGKKYGVVDLENKVQVPFNYAFIKRVAANGIYKVKRNKNYQLINIKNQFLCNDYFDEVANFEQSGGYEYGDVEEFQTLTFTAGKMRVINDKGEFVSEEVPMQPHRGFKSFDELKFALVAAFESKENILLKDFVDKIAPSEHILFYLKENPFSRKSLEYLDMDYLKQRCFEDLLEFKQNRWRESSGYGYNRNSLTKVIDFTLYRDGFVTNRRNTDYAFGDTRLLEKILRNAIKINGCWISFYFMR